MQRNWRWKKKILVSFIILNELTTVKRSHSPEGTEDSNAEFGVVLTLTVEILCFMIIEVSRLLEICTRFLQS